MSSFRLSAGVLGLAAIAAGVIPGLGPDDALAQQQGAAAPRQPPSFSGFRGTDADTGADGAAAGTGSPNGLAETLPPAPPTNGPNYGRPAPRPDPRLKYAGRPKQPKRPLPPLVPYPTSAQARQRPVQPLLPELASQPSPNVAVAPPIPRKAPPKVEADPFAPVGIGVGGLRLTPYVEVDSGYDTNPNLATSATRGSWTLRGETGFALKSEWSTHELTGSGAFGYTKYFSQPDADRPDGQSKFNLKVNVDRDTIADFEIRGSLTTQRPGTPGVGANVTNRPIIASFGATAGATRDVGTLQLGLHGLIDRTDYQDGALSNGASVPLSYDNFTAYGLQPRIAYQITPGIIPFIEGTIDTRKRDNAIDLLGFARDSNGVSARFGSTFELSRVLTGQIAGGYAQRNYADRRLSSIGAPTIDASLAWVATPLTTVTLKGATTINETTVTGSSGYVNHTGSLQLDHMLMRNLTLSAVGSYGVNDYNGVSLKETTYSAGLKAQYNVTRSLVFTGSFTHTRLDSTASGADYTANVFLLGLKLQR